ncbi:ATP-grasp domain-containing protein [Gammaproteobacteria bacterium]|nr:ATP-grasp domain-containing protein [Gammaproteobacteria bacterium]
MNKKKYLWIIGGGMLQVPLIEEARNMGLKTIVSDFNDACECSDLADIFIKIDIFDIDEHIRFYDLNFSNNNIIITGVLAAGIDAHETMAFLAKHIGLPGVNPKISSLVSNKDLFRKFMAENNFEIPKFEVISMENIDELDSIATKIGFPLIIKNTSSSGSRGTKIFYSANSSEMKRIALTAIKVSRSKKALIESFWVGTEHTVETIFDFRGEFHRCFITDREFDKSDGYALETGLIHPSRLPKDIQDEMYLLAEEVSKTMKVKIGASKFDMILTETGPKIIEMTVRLSGGFDCQYLVPAATGKNILAAAILTSQGKAFQKDFLVDTKNRTSISESIWPKPGKIIDISGIDEAKNLPGFEHIFFRYKLNDIVEPFTDCTKRICFIIVSGNSLKEAKKNMLRIKNIIKVETI